MKDLLRVSDLRRDDLELLLRLSLQFKAEPLRQREALSNQTVVLYFNKPSTRTRISMATAVARLGGVPVAVGPAELQLGRGESIEDTARTISRYAQAFVVRTFRDEDVARFAAAASIPVVNALTDRHHPCQALADLLTILETVGSLESVRVAYVGDGNNVCHSLMEAVAMMGGTIAVATPRGFAPDPGVVHRSRSIAASTGGAVEVGHDPAGAANDADVVYTDVWMSMGDPAEERVRRFESFRAYQVNEALMCHARPDAKFMHCLPDHPGEEVTPEVLSSPASVIFEQAENRLHTSVALLHALLTDRLEGDQ